MVLYCIVLVVCYWIELYFSALNCTLVYCTAFVIDIVLCCTVTLYCNEWRWNSVQLNSGEAKRSEAKRSELK